LAINVAGTVKEANLRAFRIDSLPRTAIKSPFLKGNEERLMSLVKIIVITVLIILSILFFGRFLF
jgi:hypothetical protein